MKDVKIKIAAMLKENTGTHMLDSGGAYGRSWQTNQKREFEKENVVTTDVCDGEYPEVGIEYNVFHYLTNFLDVTEDSENLQRRFEEFTEKSEDYHLLDIENFLTELGSDYRVVNTYNYDNIISQVLQYALFTFDDVDYIILQIHGGCDVRGGYTAPYIFELSDSGSFCVAQTDIRGACECSQFDNSYDGYNIEGEFNGLPENEDQLKICEVESEPFKRGKIGEDDDIIFDKENNQVVCKKCGSKIEFHVLEDF